MSEENIEVLDGMYEAFNRRDFDDAAQYVDPAVEIYPAVATLNRHAKLFGREGWKEFIRVDIDASKSRESLRPSTRFEIASWYESTASPRRPRPSKR